MIYFQNLWPLSILSTAMQVEYSKDSAKTCRLVPTLHYLLIKAQKVASDSAVVESMEVFSTSELAFFHGVKVYNVGRYSGTSRNAFQHCIGLIIKHLTSYILRTHITTIRWIYKACIYKEATLWRVKG